MSSPILPVFVIICPRRRAPLSSLSSPILVVITRTRYHLSPSARDHSHSFDLACRSSEGRGVGAKPVGVVIVVRWQQGTAKRMHDVVCGAWSARIHTVLIWKCTYKEVGDGSCCCRHRKRRVRQVQNPYKRVVNENTGMMHTSPRHTSCSLFPTRSCC